MSARSHVSCRRLNSIACPLNLWASLMARLLGRRAHLGLSRFARYASAEGIAPNQINDAAIEGFIAAVRAGSKRLM